MPAKADGNVSAKHSLGRTGDEPLPQKVGSLVSTLGLIRPTTVTRLAWFMTPTELSTECAISWRIAYRWFFNDRPVLTNFFVAVGE
jgi:hypothetical protein